jgi:hypothetical protein
MHNLPIRLDYYQYCVETWQEILARVDFSSIHTILDLCPGWAPKIELALLSTTFKGTVYAVDLNREHLSIFHKLIDPFIKSFAVKTLERDILKINTMKENYRADLIIGNHVLDDILIMGYCESENVPYAEMLTNPAINNNTWEYLARKTHLTQKITSKLTSFIDCTLSDGGTLLLSQYPSYPEKLAHNFKSQQILRHMEKQLSENLQQLKYTEVTSSLYPTNLKQHYFTKRDFFAFQNHATS